jgi:predicted ferric reductase
MIATGREAQARTETGVDYHVILPVAALFAVAITALSGAGQTLVWYFVRASGVVAYLLLTISVCTGLLVRTRVLPAGPARVDVYEAHNFAALLVLSLAGLHATALLLDAYIGFSPAQIAVPFTSSYRPLAVGFGVVALYLASAVYGSFWLRRVISQRGWRALHYGSFAVFILVTLHGVFSGADSGTAWMIAIYLGALGLVTVLLVRRLSSRSPAGTDSKKSASPRGEAPV